MGKLYIIGNGFDIAHEIKSSYWNFRRFMETSWVYDDLVYMLEDFYDDTEVDLWSEFERALGLISGENIYKTTKADVDKDDEIEREFRQHQDLMHWNTSSIRENLADAFSKWTAQISLNGVEPIYNLAPNSLFLTFNYTETLEKVYGKPDNDVLHIHGGQKNPVFGHGKEKYDNPWPPEQEAFVITDEAVDYAKDLFKEFVKPVDDIIRQHEGYFNSLKGNIDEVIIIGHSLGDVDLPYLKKIQDVAAPAKWTDYFHREKRYATKQSQADEIHDTLSSLGIAKANQNVVCDEDAVGLFV